MTPLQYLAKCLEEFPSYIMSYVVSLLAAILSDNIVTSLTLGCVALGLQTNLLIALAAFFLIHVLSKTHNTLANAIGSTGQALMRVMAPPPPIPLHQAPTEFPPVAPPVETPST